MRNDDPAAPILWLLGGAAMNDLPRSVVVGRRMAGVILLLCALATLVVLVILFGDWVSAPRVVGALGTAPSSWSNPVL